ncbi:hypothetical protein L226DRAFT_209728 [Lentinus tigrinus ALCF2SS1-7]|uniref:uncharacterized protein n=1 Tax=Lentinus tigrinus ALCF2SS1-7 TaxID=1328758 RepID=UPI001166098F|nr:hypothetical protein L226DRAFT_209728 [Lentinus tigrinus ALCF2SS1-7]
MLVGRGAPSVALAHLKLAAPDHIATERSSQNSGTLSSSQMSYFTGRSPCTSAGVVDEASALLVASERLVRPAMAVNVGTGGHIFLDRL